MLKGFDCCRGGSKYNEVIVDADAWRANPSATIEAVFGGVGGGVRVTLDPMNRDAPFS